MLRIDGFANVRPVCLATEENTPKSGKAIVTGFSNIGNNNFYSGDNKLKFLKYIDNRSFTEKYN